jgi:hypothetical protein
MNTPSTTTALEDVSVTEEATVPPPAAPPATKKIEENDILKLENAFLKIENLKRSRTIAERDIQSCEQQIQIQQTSLITLRDTLSKKYGVDLTKARIAPDGTIIPNIGGAQGPIAQALQPRN